MDNIQETNQDGEFGYPWLGMVIDYLGESDTAPNDWMDLNEFYDRELRNHLSCLRSANFMAECVPDQSDRDNIVASMYIHFLGFSIVITREFFGPEAPFAGLQQQICELTIYEYEQVYGAAWCAQTMLRQYDEGLTTILLEYASQVFSMPASDIQEWFALRDAPHHDVLCLRLERQVGKVLASILNRWSETGAADDGITSGRLWLVIFMAGMRTSNSLIANSDFRTAVNEALT